VGPGSERTWFSARMVYADAGSGCGPADDCPAPQAQGTPASCFLEVSDGVSWGSGATGACCTVAGCHQSLENPCIPSGGVWAGNGTDCATPGLCPARIYRSPDPASILDPANAIAMVDDNPESVPWESDPLLYYALDDGSGDPPMIRLRKGFLNILIHY
jgi:hypothetical protein